jgi:hypothetical protein
MDITWIKIVSDKSHECFYLTINDFIKYGNIEGYEYINCSICNVRICCPIKYDKFGSKYYIRHIFKHKFKGHNIEKKESFKDVISAISEN